MYKPFDIVITPFPFVDELGKFKYRPALAISSEEYSKSTNCTVFLMITSAKNSDFANDYKIQDYSNTNLQGDCDENFRKQFMQKLEVTLAQLNNLAITQMKSLVGNDSIKRLT